MCGFLEWSGVNVSVAIRHKSLKSQPRIKFCFSPEEVGFFDAEFFGKVECIVSI